MRKTFTILLVIMIPFFVVSSGFSEEIDSIEKTDTDLDVPKSISDQEITTRLEKIFKVTGWYENTTVSSVEGVVFLKGSVDSFEKKKWALDLIEKTEGVVAVVDQTSDSLTKSNFFKPAREEALTMFDGSMKVLPYLASALLILVAFIFIGFFAKKIVRMTLQKNGTNQLLTKTLTSLAGLCFLVVGIYFALKTSGLSTLAVTLLGGTGLVGLGLGLALKNIFENYASSIMISMKELLKMGEVVNIDGHEGVVQSVTTRGTTLMDYDGNNIILPNTQVFNSVIKNYTRNPNMRLNISVGIGYDDSIETAREVILEEVQKIKTVLTDPEPLVVVDSLGASTVNLKGHFWIDAVKSSHVKLKSLILKNIKEALIRAQISMPDDAREVVFASPLEVIKSSAEDVKTAHQASEPTVVDETSESDLDEDLSNEIDQLKKQAQKSPNAEKGENLI